MSSPGLSSIGLPLVALLLLLAAGGGVATGETPAESVEEYRAARGDTIQWELPERRELPDLRDWDLPFDLLSLLFKAIGLTLVALLVIFIVRWAADRRPRLIEPITVPKDARIQLSDRPLAAAHAAAEEGRFTDAVHLLLLGTIDEIRAALDYHVPPWLTSREILDRVPLPPQGRRPLEGIVTLVEGSHFGRGELTREDWERASAWHGALREACADGGRDG
ncbi:MAG: DUF4129 domain-containing protein [Planctomycetota bacterium]